MNWTRKVTPTEQSGRSTTPMDNEDGPTRLDRAFLILENCEGQGDVAERWFAIVDAFDGINLTGASNSIRSLVEKIDTGMRPMRRLLREVTKRKANLDSDEAREIERSVYRSSISFFSMYLFSEWRSDAFLEPLIRLLNLPDDQASGLLGDAIDYELPRYLAQTLSQDPDRIDELVCSPEINEFNRWATVRTYCYLVRDGVLSVEQVVRRLDRLFLETSVIGDDGRPALGHSCDLSTGIVETIIKIGGAGISEVALNDQVWNCVNEGDFQRIEFETAVADPSTIAHALEELPPTVPGGE